MKKTTRLLLCLFAAVLLTGCGSKKLSCSLKEDNGYLTYDYSIGFAEDKIDSIDIFWNYDFSNVEDFESINCESLEDCISKAKGLADTCNDGTTFENCKVVKETDTEVVISANVTKKQIESGESQLNSKTDRETAQKQLEDNGFTCK